jgi:predicted DNA-binding transcriptional regulator YafY
VNPELVVEIEYVNLRGEQSSRRIVPHAIHFGSSEWHPEPQWLLHAEDLRKGERRDFAMKDIKSWKPAGP